MIKKLIKGLLITTVVSSAVIGSNYKLVYASTIYTVETKIIYGIEEGLDQQLQVDFVTNPNNGPTLGILHNTLGIDGKNKYILEVTDGVYTYAFKDMNKNSLLDDYEDWRKSIDERAASLARDLAFNDPNGIRKIAGLMLFSSHESFSQPGLTAAQKAYLDGSYVRNITDASDNNVNNSVGWTNAMQAYVEASEFNVPVDFSSDPRSTAGSGDLYSPEATGSDLSAWPSNLGMAATFDINHMYNFAQATSSEYRALGIVTALGPQIDLASEPRWLRVGGTFGENIKLATDMAQAYVDGSQSTYSSSGQDLGWGSDSINAMIKHFPGDGAGEGGRESHKDAGKYAVYPGNNFAGHLIPFTQGGLNLKGKTKAATAIMMSYSIGINADGSTIGTQRMGSAYNSYKMNLLRDSSQIDFDGVVCTDWGVTSVIAGMSMAWGAENLSDAQKHYEVLKAGGDMFGGNNNATPVVEAFNLMVDEYGDTAARERFALSAKRLLRLTMRPGLFENPYLDVEVSKTITGSAEKKSQGYQAQLDSIVLLKNKNNVIQEASKNIKRPSDMTVYIPMTYTESYPSIMGSTTAAWSQSMNLNTARLVYGTVITDELQSDGTYKVPDLTNVDKVIIGMRSPNNGVQFSNSGQIVNPDGTKSYYPLSLQYGSYTANGANVRKVSIAGDILSNGSQENRSYFGATSKIYNSYDLTATLNAINAVKATGKNIPIIVSLNASNPVIVSEFEDKVDVIITSFSVSDQAILDIIEGKHEPKGLLPIQFPLNMDTVEANKEDVGQDVICYKDSEGNTYDFAYGLGWAGIIEDTRVTTYNPNRPTTEVAVKINNVKTGDYIDAGIYLGSGIIALLSILIIFKKKQ